MNTQYAAWLNGLAAARKGPVMLPTATRRLAYSHIVSLNGDFTGAAVIGQVRASPDSPSILAAFTISALSVAEGQTAFTIGLAAGTGANSTGSLPSDGNMDGIEHFPYDLLLTPLGGVQSRLFGGLLPVSGHITLPA